MNLAEYMSNMGTISGGVAMIHYLAHHPQRSGLNALRAGSDVGQWENLGSGLLLNPLIEGAEGAAVGEASVVNGVYPKASGVLTGTYDTGMVIVDGTGATEGEYQGKCCK
jgi:hypothetical protein